MGFKKHIPNLITLLNLFSGCIAVLFAVKDQLALAAFFVMLGIVFDFFDGLAARVLKVQSDLGLQLDSLADMVTSGVVPGIVMFQLMTRAFGQPFYESADSWNSDELITNFDVSYVSLLGFCITLASAYRLAKFNIDTRQTTSFIGLPTPANTILILSLPLILIYQNEAWISAILLSPYVLVGLTVLSCYLLNAEIPLFALKFKTWGFKENKVRYLFLILVFVLIALLKFMAVPVIILSYILISIFTNQKSVAK
ncbi:CDP-alcohol phosphatidyltransferase family protein [Aquimarina brevivitae]|uniref:CDP-diacylglycerol--serine O-phosphatidyltransferase n=1 Tax=Aquimarina brevivitae TaxID=323412 RepID=A0A4Q7P0F3_9FLAO|nr:CDP-alcohol phosphatidyltransferase family protein [Aquimarina brevivitae]RZS93134.1 CDP-diacylglycerol--serine O-phosphatidyltransferase [Aquimarina brevivitae]